jgi:hypothetical protein
MESIAAIISVIIQAPGLNVVTKPLDLFSTSAQIRAESFSSKGYSPKRLFTKPTQKCTTIHLMIQYVGSGNCQILFTFGPVHQMHNNGTSKTYPIMQLFYRDSKSAIRTVL